MARSWNGWCWQLGLASSLVVFGVLNAFGDCARAQRNIIPDNTLGKDRSIVLPTNNAASDQVVSGGAIRGANLFHSFSEFNVSEGGRALFYSPNPDIGNILARVTGGNSSKIMGILGTYGESAPNLFLINPNGIVFGPNARLDVRGSFVASTASSVNFADGTSFSATAPQTTPLLTVSVPIGLQFGGTAQSILNQSQALDRNDFLVGLQVDPDRTLALVGGDVALAGGALTAAGGRIEIGSVADTGLVRLTPTDKGWALEYENAQNFQDIQLSQQALVNASSDQEGGGDIQVRGRRITLTDTSSINADTSGSQNGGGVSIKGLELIAQDGSQISASTSGAGQGGNLSVTADSIKLSGIVTSANGDTIFSGLFAETTGMGAAGNLKIAAGQLLVQDGALVSTSTSGIGQGGTLEVTASDSIKLSGTGKSKAGEFPSGLFAQTQGNSAAGNLQIATRQLLVQDGAQISAAAVDPDKKGFNGQAGNLDVTASDSIELRGTSANGNIFSGLFTQNLGIGAAGNLKVSARQLLIQDRAAVTANTSSGQGGNITLLPEDLLLLRRGSNISTNAGTIGTDGDGGNITINTRIIVAVPNEDSNITADANYGKGGFIKLTAQGVFGIKRSEEPTPLSDITAYSQQNPELNGVVEINTIDVDPSSGLVALPAELVNVAGLITQGCSASGGQAANRFLVTGRGGLPPTPRETLSSNTVLEDWGTLALAPTESLSTKQRDAIKNRFGGSAVSSHPTTPEPRPIVEAQGWVIGANGQVVLTAKAPNVTPHNPWVTPANCHA